MTAQEEGSWPSRPVSGTRWGSGGARLRGELGRSGWKPTLKEVQTHVKRDRVSVSAGSLAYHGFLAFFPAIIAALGVLTLVHLGSGSFNHLMHGIGKALPAGAAGVFKGAVHAATKRTTGSVVAVVVGIAVALWSSTSAMAVLQQVLDVAYEVPSDRKFMARRLRGIPLLLLTGVLGGLAAALIVFGEPIGSGIRGVLPFSGVAFSAGWTVFRWIIAFVLVSVLFSVYYAYGPNRKTPTWRWVTPGSLLSAGVFLAGSLGFSFYISTFGAYGKTYGSFAGVAIFIFWLYLSAIAVLIGAELNAELEREGRLPSGRVRSQATAAPGATALARSAGGPVRAAQSPGAPEPGTARRAG